MEEFPRINRLPPYVFNIVNELKAAARRRGEDIIDFGMGNPDRPTPKHIVDKLCEVAQRSDTHRYSMSRGIPRLRRAICRWYDKRFGVQLDQETEAIVTIGSKEGLAHLALATVEKGDAVLVPNPSYPIHPYGFVIAGADIRHVPLVPGVDFFAELEKAIRDSWPKPKMLVLNFPGQPHGPVRGAGFFREGGGHRARTRYLGGPRPGLRRYRFRRLSCALHSPGAGRQRHCRGIFLAFQEL